MNDPKDLPETHPFPDGQTPGDGHGDFPHQDSVGRYRLCRPLGEGGFGQVYLAHDEELDRPVAVKIPHRHRVARPGDVEGYLGEARAVARLDHSAIVPVYDFGRTQDGRCYIVSKYVDGGNLAARIARGRIAREEAVQVVTLVAEALHHAHLHGVVHRDVKPTNILIDSAGRPMVADFGLALRDEDFGTGLRAQGTICYMSPEQACGEGHRVDGRSDIFSLCVVLYELLTRRRPFPGNDPREFFEQVTTMEPRPPRQLDDSIPKELERICLKGLSKRVADRYNTARDLADDLRNFLAESPRVPAPPAVAGAPVSPASDAAPSPAAPVPEWESEVRIVPKGLRAYDATDAGFFVQLLPGPRGQQGLPESIVFWKHRIETTDPGEAFTVGLMYGPSGCGKTSLVRAGILPRLAGHVLPLYVEVEAGATEARLLSRLRYVCPELPAGLGLRESLAAIRRDESLSGGKKVLLVLDQFEQWLHANRAEQQPELIQALRQCDGNRVQCLVLVRDDFWLALSRFLRELEVPLVEGHNSALVDLFDLRHARKVLTALGRAFGALPPRELARQDTAFVEEAVSGLAEDGKVVCVRLALFAEMMKGRPWTLAVLRSLGGAMGIGVRFMEETLAAQTAPPQHRLHQNAACAVLEALLPEGGTEIKGRMRSYGELLAASGYAHRPDDFRELMRILDGQLRLVTPADPEGRPWETASSSPSTTEQQWYQLTHDYLVPPLRQWLHQKRRQTRRGRTELRLAERARLWNATPEARQLPSWWEWLRILCFTRWSTWTEPQRRMMRAARRRHHRQGLILGTLVLAMVAAGVELHGRLRATALVDGLLGGGTPDAPATILKLGPFYRWARPLLVEARDDPDLRKRLRASLALLPVDPSGQTEFLCERLLDEGPQEFRVLCEALEPYREGLTEGLWSVAADSARPARGRFRAACALAAWDVRSPWWSEHADQVASWLVLENPLLLRDWAEILRPVGPALVEPLTDLYHTENPEIRHSAIIVLAEYVGTDLNHLLALNRTAQPTDLLVLTAPLRRHGPRAVELLEDELSQAIPSNAREADKDALAKQRCNAGLSLCLLGAPDKVWRHLARQDDPRLRTCLVHGLAPAGVDPTALAGQLDVERNASIRMALLWSLGGYDPAVLGKRQCDELARELFGIYRTDPDPGFHSSAEWLVRKWHYAGQLAKADAGLVSPDPVPDRAWYLSPHGHTMVVVRGPVKFQMGSPPLRDPDSRSNEPLHEEAIAWSFAVSTKEVTLEQYRRFNPKHRLPLGDLQAPVGYISLANAMEYCQWLCSEEKIGEEETCYFVDQRGQIRPKPDWLSRTGYRLPTEAEWEYSCRARTGTRRYYGHSDEYLGAYAWYTANSGQSIHPVGLLLPNDLGLFDMLGNAEEWCDAELNAFAPIRGGNAGSRPPEVESGSRKIVSSKGSALPWIGFRVARTGKLPKHLQQKGLP